MMPPVKVLTPDGRGYFGRFGGTYVAEILMPAITELTRGATDVMHDPTFWDEYLQELREFSGRPTPITPLRRLSGLIDGVQFFLKREDLNQTGAHKINNVIGQGLLAKRLGKTRVIAETGAGQHGIATATMAARFGLKATIYMGAEDVERQRPNVFWMEKLGAQVVAVEDGARTLKDAINAAMRDWSSHFEDTHYLLGTACGPHPFPMLVAWLQSVAGLEAREQMLAHGGGLPDFVYACVGGGSNALGIFQGFLDDPEVKLIGVEAQGKGIAPGQHAARLASGQGTMGIAQGYESLFSKPKTGRCSTPIPLQRGSIMWVYRRSLPIWLKRERSRSPVPPMPK
jgi:tryptophan synthase beta chain